jgi:hypothetical protein
VDACDVVDDEAATREAVRVAKAIVCMGVVAVCFAVVLVTDEPWVVACVLVVVTVRVVACIVVGVRLVVWRCVVGTSVSRACGPTLDPVLLTVCEVVRALEAEVVLGARTVADEAARVKLAAVAAARVAAVVAIVVAFVTVLLSAAAEVFAAAAAAADPGPKRGTMTARCCWGSFGGSERAWGWVSE